VLPWLLGIVMLAIYGLTLTHEIALENFTQVARAQGLLWTPSLSGPVTALVTWPFGWLPAVWIPLALNFFTAMCAALSLVWLARCVALLPHDLTKQATAQKRFWSFTPPPLMTRRAPWLPPMLAVLLCGFQVTFWQNAVTASGEMFNLLLFAYVVRCFLEYNASDRDAWLLRGAVVYGVAVANDWFLVLFFPVLLLVLIWIKRLFLLNPHQIEQMFLRRDTVKWQLLWQIPVCWLAGVSLILLPPIIASLSPATHGEFWPALQYTLYSFKTSLTHVPHTLLLTFLLIAVMPVFLIGLRFYHFLSGANRLNYFVGAVSFQVVYGFFLLVGIWIMLDAPISPHRLAPGLPTLPLYFLETLGLGFFAGHFLLTSETGPEPARKGRLSSFERRDQQLNTLTRLLKWAVFAVLLLLFAGIPAVLVSKNLPLLVRQRTNPCDTYLHQVEAALPPAGAVLIGTDSFRLICLQSDLLRQGRQGNFLLLNTEALEENTNYLGFLKKQSPGFNLNLNVPANLTQEERRKVEAVALLQQLGTNHAIYSLHPAAQSDALAEFFYFQPQGLVYRLQAYPLDVAFAPAPAPERLRGNQVFWQLFRNEQFTNLVRHTNPPPTPPVSGLLKRFLNTFRTHQEPDPHALLAGAFYACALNDWGVELQKNGQLQAAGASFADALQLNPRNAAAQINQQFNEDYQSGQEVAEQTPLETAQNLNQYRDLQHVLRDGAVDEPNICFLIATVLTESQLYRPAIAQLERVKALDPERLQAYLSLASLFNTCRDYTNGLAAANELLARSPTNTIGMVLKAAAQVQLHDNSQAIPLLDQVLTLEPTNELALINRGQAWSNLGQYPTARRDYETMLQINPNDYRAYIALADLDERGQHPASAVTNYELFLQYAPPAMREIPSVKARVQALKARLAK
jgi:tetratricopeptide (TPR) repeat protein